MTVEQQGVDSPSSSPRRLTDRVVGWLRAGYPDGVPPQDYRALLGILQRSLTPNELEVVVDELSRRAASGTTILTRAAIEQRIAEVLLGPALDGDVARVSARLASAGWPLGLPDDSAEVAGQPRTGLVARIVSWLRAGYPAGLPATDYVPLIALLRRRLSEDEVEQVGEALSAEGVVPASRVDVGAAIAGITTELPSEADVERVRQYLVDHGFPVDFAR